jgi:hypothetical protein
VGEEPARAQDAPDVAQRRGPARHELEHERRHRGVEGPFLEGQFRGEGHATLESIACRRHPLLDQRLHRTHHLAGCIDGGDADLRPPTQGRDRQIAGPDAHVQHRTRAIGHDPVEAIEERDGATCQHGRPPPVIAGGDPVVSFSRLRHPRMVPRAGGRIIRPGARPRRAAGR